MIIGSTKLSKPSHKLTIKGVQCMSKIKPIDHSQSDPPQNLACRSISYLFLYSACKTRRQRGQILMSPLYFLSILAQRPVECNRHESCRARHPLQQDVLDFNQALLTQSTPLIQIMRNVFTHASRIIGTHHNRSVGQIELLGKRGLRH